MKAERVLVLVGHPQADQSVLNAEMASRWAAHPDAEVRWIGAHPVDVTAEQAAVESAEHIVFQFPLYWYGPPACLKQWMDEVLTWGWAFGPNGGLLHGRTLQCAITVGGQLSDYTPEGKHKTSLASLMEPLERMASYVGLEWLGVEGMDRQRLANSDAVTPLTRKSTNA